MRKWAETLRRLPAGLFELAAKWPAPALAVVLLLQTVLLLHARELWYSDEIRYANAFENLFHRGHWLVLYLNGEAYPDKPPVYFWLLALLRLLMGHEQPALFFAGAALSGFLFVLATYVLARTVAGADRRTSLASGLVLLSGFYFVGLCHYSRMDLLFGALIGFSHVCLYRAWSVERAPGWCLGGFALAALAVLTKGPLGVAFPLLAGAAWLVWTGRIRRLWRRDAAMGASLCVAILLLWVAGAGMVEGGDYLRNIFGDQIYKRATATWHHAQPFYHYALTLPLVWLPWSLLLAVLPVRQLIRRDFWAGIWASRRNARSGGAYLWAAAISGFVLLSSVSIKIVVYLLPLFAPLAILSARSLLGLGQEQSRRVYGLMAWLFLLLAGAQAAAALVLPTGLLPEPWTLPVWGLIPCAVIMGLTGCALRRWTDRTSPTAGLMVALLGLTLWLQPLGLLVAPSLDRIMSPAAQGRRMGEYADKGYLPMAYRIYPGTYTYYAGRNILETKDLEAVRRELAERRGKVVVGMRRSDWDQWLNRPDNLAVVHEQWIVDRPFVLAAGNSTRFGSPARESETSAFYSGRPLASSASLFPGPPAAGGPPARWR